MFDACELLSIPERRALERGWAKLYRNIHSGATARSSDMIHGVLILAAVLPMPTVLSKVPICCLAAT